MTNINLIFLKPSLGDCSEIPHCEATVAATAGYLDNSTIAEGLYFTRLHCIATEPSLLRKE